MLFDVDGLQTTERTSSASTVFLEFPDILARRDGAAPATLVFFFNRRRRKNRNTALNMVTTIMGQKTKARNVMNENA